jgi:hypothetical protein
MSFDLRKLLKPLNRTNAARRSATLAEMDSLAKQIIACIGPKVGHVCILNRAAK